MTKFFGNIIYKVFLWLDKKQLCPCAISCRFVEFFRIEKFNIALSDKICDIGLRMCTRIIMAIPMTEEELKKLKALDSGKFTINTKVKGSDERFWN